MKASDRVHDRLRRDILEGRLRPGISVPSERTLAAQMQINRHAVREALKRLQQAGLIQISQGGATRVRDWRDWAGLEVLLDLADADGEEPSRELVRSVLEMRASVGIDAARRCAERADQRQRSDIAAAAAEVAAALGDDPALADELYAALWLQIVDASENIAYRLALNSLAAALDAHAGMAAKVRPSEPESIVALGAAIRMGDADAAQQSARVLLERAALAFGNGRVPARVAG